MKTRFEFGRWEPEVDYFHNIWTGEWIDHQHPPVLYANCIGFGLNYGNEIGIGSGWEQVTFNNLDETCSEFMSHCQLKFEAFPAILKGLELDVLKHSCDPSRRVESI